MFEKSRRSILAATSGGTYRVHDSSTGAFTAAFTTSLTSRLHSSVPPRPKYLSITVVFLDDTKFTFEVEKYAKGSVLLDKVYQHLELIERDYFGLQFHELLPPPEVIHPLSNPHLRWVESSKLLKKQIRFTKPNPPQNSHESYQYQHYQQSSPSLNRKKRRSSQNGGNENNMAITTNTGFMSTQTSSAPPNLLPSATVYFRVKFFVEDPSRLNEEYTRYHVYLQVRKDVLEGRLPVTPSSMALLTSYAVQSELGDFQVDEHDEFGYYLRHQSSTTSFLDTSYYKTGGTGTDEFLRKVAQLHKAHRGQTPADAEYNYLDHTKRLEAYGVAFHRVRDSSGKEIQVGVSSSGLGVYHNGIKINTFSWSKITKIAFKRKNFFIQLRRELSEDYDTLLMFDCFQYRSCKLLWKSCVEHHAFFRLSVPPGPHKRSSLLLFTLGSKFRYSGRTEYQTREDKSFRNLTKEKERERRTFFRSPSKRLLLLRQTLRLKSLDKDQENQSPAHEPKLPRTYDLKMTSAGVKAEPQISPDNGTGDPYESEGANLHLFPRPMMHRSANIMNLKVAAATGLVRANDKVQSLDKVPRKAWGEQRNSRLTDEDGGYIQSGVILHPLTVVPNSSTNGLMTNRGIAYVDDEEIAQAQYDDGNVLIRLEPDPHGKFGFNVKGGADMNCPVLVSRVAPGTAADQCYPRLSEGDQLMAINGKDTSGMPHRDVVNSIRQAATTRKELILKVRQNVYTTDDFEEPAFQYVPDIPLLHLYPSKTGEVVSPLISSMLLLTEAIESDSISNQFELVYRRKPGLSCEVAKLSENVNKNRYRDILPYDSTRVVLQTSRTGDYINANYVTMEIPVSGVVNRYIACQGPLSATCVDFWVMIWETQSPLIVMLTPVCERGRVKCHPYWSQSLHSSIVYDKIQITTIKEMMLPHWIQRDFRLKHLDTMEERIVAQLQFQSWPDHGVPEDPLSFVRFIEQVRKAKLGTVEPTIVHCSAGIGRTGVLILMETAECLIEANQPVYPLEIVTQMRNQRPLMIQTPSQYRFVCQCALKVYQQGLIRPLPEFNVLSSPQKQVRRAHAFNIWGQS